MNARLTTVQELGFARAFQAYLRYHHWIFESQRARFLAANWIRKNAGRLQQNRRTFGEDMVHALRIRQCFVTQWNADEIERMANAFEEWFAAAMQHYQRTGRWIQLPTQGQGRPYGTFYGLLPAEDDAEDLP